MSFRKVGIPCFQFPISLLFASLSLLARESIVVARDAYKACGIELVGG